MPKPKRRKSKLRQEQKQREKIRKLCQGLARESSILSSKVDGLYSRMNGIFLSPENPSQAEIVAMRSELQAFVSESNIILRKIQRNRDKLGEANTQKYLHTIHKFFAKIQAPIERLYKTKGIKLL